MKKIAISIIIFFYSGMCMLGMRDREGSLKSKERVCRINHSSEEFLEKIYLHPSFVKSGTWTNMLFDVNQLSLSKDLPTKAKAVLEFIEKEKNVSFNVNVLFPEPLRHEAPFLVKLIKKMHTKPAENLEPLVQKHLKKLPLILGAANYLNIPALLDASVNVAAKYLVKKKQLAKFLSNTAWWPHVLNKDVGTKIVKKIIDSNPELIKGIPIPCIKTFSHKVSEFCFGPLCFSPCGKYILSLSKEEFIELWDIKTGRCIQTFYHKGYSVCFSPCGKYLASGSYGEIKLWNVKTGACMHICSAHDRTVVSVCFSPCGKYLASGTSDYNIKLWDVKTGRCIQKFTDHSWDVNSVCFSPCGKFIVLASEDKTIKFWDVKTGKCIQPLTDHSWDVNSICFKRGKYLVSPPCKKKFKLWDVKTGRCTQTFSGHSDSVYAVCFSPCGKFISSGSLDTTIKLWHVKKGTCIQTCSDHSDSVYAVCFSPCGDYIASASLDTTIKLWDLTYLKNVYKLPLPHILFLLACKKLSSKDLPKPTLLNLEEKYNEYMLQRTIK